MKFTNKIFLGFSFSLLMLSTTSFNASDSNVYLCQGKYSKKYHLSKTCRGLSNWKAAIVKVTLSDAKQKGKTLCGWED